MHAKKHNGSSAEAELNLDHELPPAEENDAPAQADAEAAAKSQRRKTRQRNWSVSAPNAQPISIARRASRPSSKTFASAASKQQQEFKEYALADAMTTLLPILDSLDRALNTKAASLEDFHAGIELIDKQFHDALAKLGVQPVAAEGEPFDPNLHQAIQMVDTEEVDDNHVLDELQRGYKLKDRLLRPAMVRVARHPKTG